MNKSILKAWSWLALCTLSYATIIVIMVFLAFALVVGSIEVTLTLFKWLNL